MNVKGQHVLVTGGTGSFGHKMAKEFANSGAASVTIFSRDEKKQYDMQKRFSDFNYIIGDVRNFDSVKAAFRKKNVIFHAAALKQVPSCENYPYEALQTNCIGAQNVRVAAIECGVRKVVALSTDKGVLPTNCMGQTKALAEKIITARPGESDTIFCVTRYGNVAGTRGSVLPLWKSQMNALQPLSVTDLTMTRFLMNLVDSVRLVAFALMESLGGEVYVYKAPAVAIRELLDAFALRYQYSGGFKIIGRRPGEKLHECLVHEDELYKTCHAASFVVIEQQPTNAVVQLPAPYVSNTAPNISKEGLQEMLAEAERDMEEML